jgi:hypothetical protein
MGVGVFVTGSSEGLVTLVSALRLAESVVFGLGLYDVSRLDPQKLEQIYEVFGSLQPRWWSDLRLLRLGVGVDGRSRKGSSSQGHLLRS